MKKVHRVIKFNRNDLKPYIELNTDLRKESKKHYFEKEFFKLMNNAIFGKTMENVRKHRNINFVTTQRRRNNLVSEPNYHIAKIFTEHLLAIKKTPRDTDQ